MDCKLLKQQRYEISGTGTFVSAAGGYIGGGLARPRGIANDANFSVTRLSHSGSLISGPNGYLGGDLGSPYGIATDGAGNSWIGSQNPFLLT